MTTVDIPDAAIILRTALSAELEAGAVKKLELSAAGRHTFTAHLVREAGMRAALFVVLDRLGTNLLDQAQKYHIDSRNNPYRQGMRDGLFEAGYVLHVIAGRMSQTE